MFTVTIPPPSEDYLTSTLIFICQKKKKDISYTSHNISDGCLSGRRHLALSSNKIS